MQSAIHIRRAQQADLPALGRLGAALLILHHDLDHQRFIAPGSDPASGYAWFLGTQLAREDAAIFVAERDGELAGYVYASIEPHSWKELRDEAGFIHDLMIAEHGRRLGLATRLLDEAMDWIRSRGAPRVILWSADQNTAAQRLFEGVGFRRTMVELTRELGDDTRNG